MTNPGLLSHAFRFGPAKSITNLRGVDSLKIEKSKFRKSFKVFRVNSMKTWFEKVTKLDTRKIDINWCMVAKMVIYWFWSESGFRIHVPFVLVCTELFQMWRLSPRDSRLSPSLFRVESHAYKRNLHDKTLPPFINNSAIESEAVWESLLSWERS